MRGPHRYGMGRAIEGDAGGVADLQTDVMRFMAILALCLVVIFALVQSIPQPVAATPEASEPPEPIAEPTRTAAPAPVVEAPPAPRTEVTPQPAPGRIVLTRPEPGPAPARPTPTQVVEPPAPSPAPAEPAAESVPAPAPAQQGFTLQFDSDVALTRLVARDEVGLYALRGSKALRMSVNRGRVSFWPSSTPNAFHEMDPSTVPADVRAALGRTQAADEGVTWGVTLPPNLQRELDSIVAANDGGALFIAGDGRIRLER